MEYDIIIKKLFGFAIILLFLRADVIPSTGMVFNDDTTPPVTTHTLKPPEPNGDNGWYVSDVNVTLNATDDMSGVKEIRYLVTGVGGIIPGDNGSFIITEYDEDILVEYWAIDNSGNIESKKSFTIDIDKKKPDIDPDGVHWQWYQTEPPFGPFYFRFWTNATDYPSGMDRVEMYINEELHEINNTPDGRRFEFVIKWSNAFVGDVFCWEHYDVAGNMVEDLIYMDWDFPNPSIIGFICNPEVINQSVTFFAIIVRYFILGPYGWSWNIAIFKHFTIPNDYKGYIGRYFICVEL